METVCIFPRDLENIPKDMSGLCPQPCRTTALAKMRALLHICQPASDRVPRAPLFASVPVEGTQGWCWEHWQ